MMAVEVAGDRYFTAKSQLRVYMLCLRQIKPTNETAGNHAASIVSKQLCNTISDHTCQQLGIEFVRRRTAEGYDIGDLSVSCRGL